MVLGIVSVCVLPLGCCCGLVELVALPLGIIAIVFGVRARSQITQSQGALSGGGKATAGIVTGAVGAGIAIVLGVLIALFIGFSVLNPGGLIPSPTP